jgi:hypothetical protein
MKDEKDSVLSKAKSLKMPEIDLKSLKLPEIDIHSTIKTGVNKTNSLLFTLEAKKSEASNFASSRIRPLVTQAKRATTKAFTVYENRKNYGPQIVTGSAVAVGILVAARRGKVPGALMGGITGAAAAKNIYSEV